MPSHRSQRIAKAIREVVSTAILFEVADPRIHSVTVLGADVSGDLRHATIFVSVMGTQAEQDRAIQGLKHAAGFLQSRVAARLQTRFTPVLNFKLDDSVKKSIELSRLIDEAIASDQRQNSPEPQPARMPDRLPEAIEHVAESSALAHPAEGAVSDST
jgi:ribosome-binding factor A